MSELSAAQQVAHDQIKVLFREHRQGSDVWLKAKKIGDDAGLDMVEAERLFARGWQLYLNERAALDARAAEIARELEAKGAGAPPLYAGMLHGVTEPKPEAKPAAPKAAGDAERLAAVARGKARLNALAAERAKAAEAKAKPEPEALPQVQLPTVVEAKPAKQRLMLSGKAFDLNVPPCEAGLKQVLLLNRKHAAIGNYGSKMMVLGWERWPLDANIMVPIFAASEDFKKRYMHRYAEVSDDEGKVVRKPLGAYWLGHTMRQTYDGVDFDPGSNEEVLIGNRLNLWNGFAVEPKPGRWPLMERHIYHVLGNDDPKAGEYIMRWTAWMFQYLGVPAEVALVFQSSEEGAGKGMFARACGQALGQHWLPVSDQKHLTGGFSGHLQHCVFLFLDEAFWAGSVKDEGRLKSLITEPKIMIEPKYVQPFPVRNRLHIMMASNNDWVVPAGHSARRYAVFKVNEKYVGDLDYHAALAGEIEGGGVAAMLYDMLSMELGRWHPRMIYRTSALLEQKQHSLRGLDAWIEGMLQAGSLPHPVKGYPNRAMSGTLLEAAKGFDQYTNDTAMALRLRAVFKPNEPKPFNREGKRGWEFPPLAECRAAWEKRNGGEWNWHSDAVEWAKGVYG